MDAMLDEFIEIRDRSAVVRVAQRVGLLVLALSLWVGSAQAQQRQSNFQLCFPLISWFGPQHPTPLIDGQIDNDAGWDGAFKYVYGNGSTIPDVIVRGIRDSNNLYLGIQAYNLDSLTAPSDQATLVVLAFDPGNGTDSQVGAPANMLRLHVFPIVTNPIVPSHGNAAFATYYWSGGLSTWGTSGTLNPAWLAGDVQVGYDADPNNPGKFRWSLEMKLNVSGNLAMPNPTNGLTLPDSGPFGFYFDAFPVVKLGINETLVPQYWPANAPEPGCTVGSCTPDGQTPAASMWGNATRDPACGGASVTLDPMATNIFTNQNPISKIALNAPNTFGAYIQNTSVDATGGVAVPTSAQVNATFRIANWGLGPPYQLWGLVPTQTAANPNPTPVATIPASACTGNVNNSNASCIVQTGPWDLTGTPAANDYNTPTTSHQCIRVELAPAPGSNTVVLNSVAQRNMDFGPASRFDRIAEISAKGYPLRAGAAQGADQVFDLHISIREEVLKPGQAATATGQANTLGVSAREGGKRGVVSQLTWIANGCRHTGRYMTILEHRLEICEPVGAFGYVVRHVGKAPVEKWNVRLTGPNLAVVAGQPNTYQILIPQDGVATVTTHAEPQEPSVAGGGKVAVFLDAGAGVPHGTFGNAFKTGFSLNAGLEYILTSHFSAEGIFGYHRFAAKLGGGALNLYQFSANGKAYLTSGGPFRPFVNAGIGGYDFTPGGGTHFGGNVGAGVLREFGPHWGLQASYNFHTVSTPGAATKFSTIQGGIRYVF